MKIVTFKALSRKQTGKAGTYVLCSFINLAISHAQVRSYNLVYSDNIKGGTAMFGNTLLHILILMAA